MTKFRTCTAVATLTAVGLAMALTPCRAAAQAQQVVLVTISPYDELKKDVEFVGKLAGQPNAGQQLEGAVMLFAQGLPGVDRSRPIGIAVLADGGELMPVVMVPVTNFNQLVGLAQGLGADVAAGGGGSTEITMQDETFYAKEVNGWALVAQNSLAFQAVEADPAKTIASLNDQYDLAGRVYIQNIPEQYRTVAIDGLKMGIEQGMQREPGQSEEEFRQAKQLVMAQMSQFEKLLNEANELTFGVNLDAEQEQANIDFSFTAKEGTQLAQQLNAYSETTTNYAGFYQPDAAVMLTFASDIPQEEVEQVREMFGMIRNQIATAIEQEADIENEQVRETVQAAVNDFVDAFLATVESGKMDGGAVLHADSDSLTLVVGGACAQPEKVVSGLKRLEALVQEEEDFPGVNWNAQSHAGIDFHTMMVPLPGHEEEARQLFGDQVEVCVGTGDGSVYFAFGRNALDATKGVIDQSKSSPGKKIAPMEMSVALGQIMNMVAAMESDPVAQKVADVLATEAAGQDHVRITVKTIDRGVQYRIFAERGVFKAIAAAVAGQSEQQFQQGNF